LTGGPVVPACHLPEILHVIAAHENVLLPLPSEFHYWTVREITPDLDTWLVELEIGPVQPVLNAVAASKTGPRQAVTQIPRAIFLLLSAKGIRSNGSRRPGVTGPETVSAKTTVIWYVPAGVVAEVVMVTIPVVDE